MEILSSRKKKMIEKDSIHGYADELQIPISYVYEHLKDLKKLALLRRDSRKEGAFIACLERKLLFKALS